MFRQQGQVQKGFPLRGVAGAGMKFTGRDERTWDECPAMRLEWDFMGMRIELGGDEAAGYTLEIGTPLYALGDGNDVGDLSDFIQAQLARIEGITIVLPKY